MNKEQYKSLKNSNCVICVDDVSNPLEDKTLLYGYTLDRDTFHVYVMDGTLHRIIYNRPSNILIKYDAGDSIDIDKLIPSKRVYPQYSDFEFCQILIERGATIPFTTFDEEVGYPDVPFYGLTHNDFKDYLDSII